MGEEDIDFAEAAWAGSLELAGIGEQMVYRPFNSTTYWNEPVRILLCNLETYGYGGRKLVSKELFCEWMRLRRNTSRYSALFVAGLLQTLSGESASDPKFRFGESFRDDDFLESTLDRFAYMNFRKESGLGVREDSGKILAEVGSSRDEIKSFIMAHEPDVFLITGHTGVTAYNSVFSNLHQISYDTTARFGSMVVSSCRHFAIPDYEYNERKISEIFHVLNKTG